MTRRRGGPRSPIVAGWLCVVASVCAALIPTSGAGFSTSTTTAFSFAAAAAAPATDTIFDTYTPANPAFNDSNGLTVGVKFRPKVMGQVTQIKFYKGSGNTGTHIGKVWNLSGTELGSVTFSGETASGWQTATLGSPVTVSAWQTYIVGVFMPAGHYAYEAGVHSTTRDRTLITVPAYGAAGQNSLYHYLSSPSFVEGASNGASYGLDLTFASTGTARTGPLYQQNTGSLSAFSTTSTVTLPESTTAGNTLILAYSASSTVNTPSGWTLDKSQVNSQGTYLFRKTAVAGETSWTVTNTGGALASWWIAEVTGMTASPFDVAAGNGATSQTAWTTSSITPTSGNRLLIAAIDRHGAIYQANDTANYTNSFAKTGEAQSTLNNGNGNSISVATRSVAANGSTGYSTGNQFNASADANAIIASYKLP